MKVRLVHGTCVEIKGEGIYSLPRGEGQAEHSRAAAFTASAMLCCLGHILCFFLSAVCTVTSGRIWSSALLPPSAYPPAAWLEGCLPCGTDSAWHPLAEAPCN